MIDSQNRALKIALKSRQFGLLADYPDTAVESRGERIERTSEPHRPGGMSELDANLIERAGELDRLCGHAVRTLRDKSPKPLLDTLGTLSADRILAIYCALPEPRQRAVVKRDVAWSYAVTRAPEHMDRAFARVEQFAAKVPVAGPRSHAALTEFRRERRRYAAGLPHGLTPEQIELVEAGREDTTALLVAREAMDRAGLDRSAQQRVLKELVGTIGSA